MSDRGMRATAVTVLVGGLLLGAVAGAVDPLQDKALRAGVVPDADLLVTGDAAGWRQAPIQAALDAIQAEMAAKAPPGGQRGLGQARIDARLNRLIEGLGVSKDDLTAMVASARVRGLAAPAGPMSPQLALQQIGLVLAFRMSKPLSVARIRLALGNLAAEEGMELMFEKGDYKGATLLSVVRPDQPGKTTWLPHEFTVALLDGDTGGYVGTEADVRAAVDRFSAGAPAAFPPALQAAQDSMDQAALTRLFYIPGEALRGKARDQAARLQGQNPMLGGAMQAVAGLQTVTIGAKGSDRISLRLAAAFASSQEALQMKTMVDAMVLGMGKMMLMQAVGRPIPLVENLSSSQDGAVMAIAADLTEEDCRALAELRVPGGRGMPPVPGVPGGIPAAPAPAN